MSHLPQVTVEFRPGAGPLYDPPEGWLDRPAEAGAYASTPHHASLAITGDLRLRAEITMPQWSFGGEASATLIGRWDTAGGDLSFALFVERFGTLLLTWSPDGATSLFARSTALPAGTAGTRLAVEAHLDVDNGAGGRTVTFRTAPSSAGPWTVLGAPVVTAGVTSVHAGTAPLTVGSTTGGVSAGRPMLVHAAEVRNSSDTVVAAPTFAGHPDGTTSFPDSAGRTWTTHGTATIVPADDIPWVDITDSLVSATWTTGRTDERSPHQPGEATIVLDNYDRLFDPEHTAGTYYGQLLPRVPFRLRAIHEATTYDLFYGFVDRGWEQDYEPSPFATCRVHLVDLLGVLAGRTLDGVYKTAVRKLDPLGFWPLDEDRGESVTDLGSGGNDGTVMGGVRLGGTPVAPGLGGSAEFDGVNGSITVTRSPILPNVRESSVVAVFSTQVRAEAGSDHPLFVQLDGNTFAHSHQFRLYVGTTGFVEWSYLEPGFIGDSGQVTGVYAADGRRHIAFGQSSALGIQRGVNVDATDNLVIEGGAATNEVSAGVAIGGTPFASHPDYSDNQFEGTIGPVAIWSRPLTLADRDSLLAAIDALDGQRSDQHIAWVLDQLGVPAALRNLDEGRSHLGPATTEGVEALDYIRQVVDTEQGAFYVDHHDGGRLRFVERYNAWLGTRATSPQATFTDETPAPAGQHHYSADVRPTPNGADSIVNEADVNWVGGKLTARDQASVDRYGPQRRTIRTVATTATLATSIGQWAVLTSAEPKPRVRELPVHPGGDYDLFPDVLDLRELDRITLRRHPQQQGDPIVDELLIEGATHRITHDSDWYVTYSLSGTTPVTLFTLGTSVLGGPDVLAY